MISYLHRSPFLADNKEVTFLLLQRFTHEEKHKIQRYSLSLYGEGRKKLLGEKKRVDIPVYTLFPVGFSFLGKGLVGQGHHRHIKKSLITSVLSAAFL